MTWVNSPLRLPSSAHAMPTLDAETDAAEDAYRAAQAALESAPSEATLSTGRRSATIVHDAADC